MFKVGQKVVCINDAFNLADCYNWEKLPLKGEIYTIREFVGDNHIRLVEIVNRAGYYRLLSGGVGFSESCFLISRFRSIDYTFGEQVCESLEVITEPELA